MVARSVGNIGYIPQFLKIGIANAVTAIDRDKEKINGKSIKRTGFWPRGIHGLIALPAGLTLSIGCLAKLEEEYFHREKHGRDDDEPPVRFEKIEG